MKKKKEYSTLEEIICNLRRSTFSEINKYEKKNKFNFKIVRHNDQSFNKLGYAKKMEVLVKEPNICSSKKLIQKRKNHNKK